jgi:hypothetical protein
MTTGDYWFTNVYKSQAAERIRAAEQERLAAEVRSPYREQQRAARLRRHQVRLTATKNQTTLWQLPAGLPRQPRSSSGSSKT